MAPSAQKKPVPKSASYPPGMLDTWNSRPEASHKRTRDSKKTPGAEEGKDAKRSCLRCWVLRLGCDDMKTCARCPKRNIKSPENHWVVLGCHRGPLETLEKMLLENITKPDMLPLTSHSNKSRLSSPTNRDANILICLDQTEEDLWGVMPILKAESDIDPIAELLEVIQLQGNCVAYPAYDAGLLLFNVSTVIAQLKGNEDDAASCRLLVQARRLILSTCGTYGFKFLSSRFDETSGEVRSVRYPGSKALHYSRLRQDMTAVLKELEMICPRRGFLSDYQWIAVFYTLCMMSIIQSLLIDSYFMLSLSWGAFDTRSDTNYGPLRFRSLYKILVAMFFRAAGPASRPDLLAHGLSIGGKDTTGGLYPIDMKVPFITRGEDCFEVKTKATKAFLSALGSGRYRDGSYLGFFVQRQPSFPEFEAGCDSKSGKGRPQIKLDGGLNVHKIKQDQDDGLSNDPIQVMAEVTKGMEMTAMRQSVDNTFEETIRQQKSQLQQDREEYKVSTRSSTWRTTSSYKRLRKADVLIDCSFCGKFFDTTIEVFNHISRFHCRSPGTVVENSIDPEELCQNDLKGSLWGSRLCQITKCTACRDKVPKQRPSAPPPSDDGSYIATKRSWQIPTQSRPSQLAEDTHHMELDPSRNRTAMERWLRENPKESPWNCVESIKRKSMNWHSIEYKPQVGSDEQWSNVASVGASDYWEERFDRLDFASDKTFDS